MAKLEIVKDSEGNKIVLIPEILFFNKQNIEWELVEQYLEKYVGEIVEIAETREVVYIGKKFPDEYSGSLYTKANAAQGIMEMIEIAAQKVFCENRKEKHSQDAQKGWYYYHTRFALPLYNNKNKTEEYNVYTACLVINCASNGKLYLYDIVDIKKRSE